MQSHHNLKQIFYLLCGSSKANNLASTPKQLLLDLYNDEASERVEGLWKRGSSIDLFFRLVMFFNSLPSVGSRSKPLVPFRASERQKFCSPQLFKLMAVLKAADLTSRNTFESGSISKSNREILKATY